MTTKKARRRFHDITSEAKMLPAAEAIARRHLAVGDNYLLGAVRFNPPLDCFISLCPYSIYIGGNVRLMTKMGALI
jgi:hypothetical protein